MEVAVKNWPSSAPMLDKIAPIFDNQVPERESQPNFNVVFLTANSGGGHNGIMKGLIDLFSDVVSVQWQSVDFYKESPLQILRQLSSIRSRNSLLWQLFLRSTNHPCLIRAWTGLIKRFAVPQLINQIDPAGQAPDAIIATHHLAAHYLNDIAQLYDSKPLRVIAVSDYVPHALWLAQSDLYLVASDTGFDRIRQMNRADHNILKTNILPATKAIKKPTNGVVKSTDRPGINKERINIVASSGLDGTSISRLLDLLGRLDSDRCGELYHISVVCGLNLELQKYLKSFQQNCRRLSLEIVGQVDDLPSRLAAADIALLRAGPQTVSEALTNGTPVIAFDWHAHERATLDILQRYDCGFASRCSKRILRELSKIASLPEYLFSLKRAATEAAAAAPNVNFVNDLLDFIREHKNNLQISSAPIAG